MDGQLCNKPPAGIEPAILRLRSECSTSRAKEACMKRHSTAMHRTCGGACIHPGAQENKQHAKQWNKICACSANSRAFRALAQRATSLRPRPAIHLCRKRPGKQAELRSSGKAGESRITGGRQLASNDNFARHLHACKRLEQHATEEAEPASPPPCNQKLQQPSPKL